MNEVVLIGSSIIGIILNEQKKTKNFLVDVINATATDHLPTQHFFFSSCKQHDFNEFVFDQPEIINLDLSRSLSNCFFLIS